MWRITAQIIKRYGYCSFTAGSELANPLSTGRVLCYLTMLSATFEYEVDTHSCMIEHFDGKAKPI